MMMTMLMVLLPPQHSPTPTLISFLLHVAWLPKSLLLTSKTTARFSLARATHAGCVQQQERKQPTMNRGTYRPPGGWSSRVDPLHTARYARTLVAAAVCFAVVVSSQPSPTAAHVANPLPGFNNHLVGSNITRYALFSILNQTDVASRELEVVVGSVVKALQGNPLFRGTNEWEHNIDNGYSSVLYDANDTFGLGKYRVYYTAADPSFGGAIPGESSGSATLYATSDDGITFHKPSLGRVTFQNSTDNNILWDGTTAVAVYDDAGHDANASARFKAWGNLPGLGYSDLFGPRQSSATASRSDDGEPSSSSLLPSPATSRGQPPLTYTAQLGGSAVSANGLNFSDYRRLQNPSSSKTVHGTWRFDAQASLYYDPVKERYTGTMRFVAVGRLLG